MGSRQSSKQNHPSSTERISCKRCGNCDNLQPRTCIRNGKSVYRLYCTNCEFLNGDEDSKQGGGK